MSISRPEAMNSYEKVFARLCLEHGWASRAQIADAVRARQQESQGASLASLLITRGVLTSDQAAVLQSEAADVTKSGDFAEVREDDTRIGQLLVEGGLVAAEQVQKALAVQHQAAASKAPVPRLGEILIEQGALSYSQLQGVLQRQTDLVRLACSTCGKRYTVEKRETGKVYLCQQCAGALGSSTRMPTVENAEPDEVLRAAAMPANVLGKYILVSQIGKGAMGAVYKAWDRGLRRWVAIKVLLATQDANLVLRFRREAETAAAIQHPNIVPIYDVGESEGRPFLVMKYVEGSTLSGMSLTLEQASIVALQAARGVASAHEREVIHRDLKPGNVMIDGAGHVYVMDFGLARDLFGGSNLTAPGTLMGTPSYMPPEQALGKTSELDRSSDVYSLGAVLYELVTGRPPFRSQSIAETVRQVIDEPVVPPSKVRPEVPAALEAVILRALEKEKSKRYPTAAQFAQALEAIAGSPVPGTAALARPAEPPKKRSVMKIFFWALILLVLSVLSGLGVLQLLRGGVPK